VQAPRDGGSDTPATAEHRGRRTAAAAALAVCLLALTAALAATLARTDERRLGTNDVVVDSVLGTLHGSHRVCQDEERIPAGAAAIVLSVVPGSEPRATLAVEIAAGRRTVATGAGHRWEGDSAVVALRSPVADDIGGRVCIAIRTRPGGGEVGLFGAPARDGQGAVADGSGLGGRLRFEYRQLGERSWWAFAPAVMDRIGRNHAWSGRFVAVIAVLLTIASILLASWQLVRTSR
jgi:hypothetical protein